MAVMLRLAGIVAAALLCSVSGLAFPDGAAGELVLAASAVALRPGVARERYREANDLADRGEFRAAIEAYGQAIAAFPTFHEAIDNRGLTWMDLGEWDLAIADFDASLLIHPEGFTAFFSRGEAFLRSGRLDEAEAIFTEGLTRFPDDRDLFEQHLAIIRDHRGGPAESHRNLVRFAPPRARL